LAQWDAVHKNCGTADQRKGEWRISPLSRFTSPYPSERHYHCFWCISTPQTDFFFAGISQETAHNLLLPTLL
jgi:hypothetical protein